MFSSRLSLLTRSLTAARQSGVAAWSSHKATPALLKLSSPPNSVAAIRNFASTAAPKQTNNTSSTIGEFFKRNKLLLKRGAAGTFVCLGGYQAYTMQRDKEDWHSSAVELECWGKYIFSHPGLGCTTTIEEDIEAFLDRTSTLRSAKNADDITWYDIGLHYYTFFKVYANALLHAPPKEQDAKELLELKEITFPELKELLGRDDVRAFKIVVNLDANLAQVQHQTRLLKSDETPRYHLKIINDDDDDEGEGCPHSLAADPASWYRLAGELGFGCNTGGICCSHESKNAVSGNNAVSVMFTKSEE